MIQRILLFLGYPTVNLRHIAHIIADEMVTRYPPTEYDLDELATKTAMRTDYMRIAQRYGLPAHAQSNVADMAWKEIVEWMPEDKRKAAKVRRRRVVELYY